MSTLLQASDDALGLILSFLDGKDVIHLMATGSKRLIARVSNTTRLFWRFTRPSTFPSCSFAFPHLMSLTIESVSYDSYLCLNGRSLLPPEPMVSLESLVVSFSTAYLFLTPPPTHTAPSLASSFPRLTSLSISSNTYCILADDWPKSLPQGLLSLCLKISTGNQANTCLKPSSFDHLPTGLRHMDFGFSCRIGAGKINLLRFPDLQALHMTSANSWDVLNSLPDSIEELIISCGGAEAMKWPISKFPPRLRVLKLHGECLELEYDGKAPKTLEELDLVLENVMTVQDFENCFHTKNLRLASGIGRLDPNALAQLLPNLESLNTHFLSSELSTFELLPKKTKKIFIADHSRTSPSVSFKHLPASLEDLSCSLLCQEDVTELPKGLSALLCQKSPQQPDLTIPPAALRQLPSRLTRLTIDTDLLESAECFQALPASLKFLALAAGLATFTGDMLEGIIFPKSLGDSLETLRIISGSRLWPAQTTESLFPKLSEFSRLSDLRIGLNLVISSTTLSHLPKTLTILSLEEVEFANCGLPMEQTPTSSADWKEGVLSRLPEGLVSLSVRISESSISLIDFRMFSHLPARLMGLTLDTRCGIWSQPKSLRFFAAQETGLLELLLQKER